MFMGNLSGESLDSSMYLLIKVHRENIVEDTLNKIANG